MEPELPARLPSSEHLLTESKVFCMYPWISLDVGNDGDVRPCCVNYARMAPLGSLRKQTLRELWNSESIKRLRLNMLNGRPSPECVKCYVFDRNGIRSYRRRVNTDFGHHLKVVEATRPDGTVSEFNMRLLDIRFSNLCNFRCRICGPLFSTAWSGDMRKMREMAGHKDSHGNSSSLLTPLPNPEDLWKQVEPLIPGLEEIYFAGGEPLIMEEHYRLLQQLMDAKLFHVRLLYNTNFSIMTYKGMDVLEQWKKFDTVIIRASLDGMGRRGEYLRKGQSWDQVIHNRKRMMEVCPNAEFAIDSTLSAMNALHLPDFYEDWLDKELVIPQNIRMRVLTHPETDNVQILPQDLKNEVEAKYQACCNRAASRYGENARPMIETLTAGIRFMKERDLSDQLGKFRQKTRILDVIRAESFADVFPEMSLLMRER